MLEKKETEEVEILIEGPKKSKQHMLGGTREIRSKRKKRLKGKMSGWACLPTLQGFSKEVKWQDGGG